MFTCGDALLLAAGDPPLHLVADDGVGADVQPQYLHQRPTLSDIPPMTHRSQDNVTSDSTLAKRHEPDSNYGVLSVDVLRATVTAPREKKTLLLSNPTKRPSSLTMPDARAKLEKVETFGSAFRRTRRGRAQRWADPVTPPRHGHEVRLLHQPPASRFGCSKTPPTRHRQAGR